LPVIARSIAILAFALCALAAEPPKEHVPDSAKGRELFQTCAGCHNYANDQTKYGPSLKTLFGRVTLHSGEPVTDANVRAVILDGYNRMPSFRYNFKPEEIDDLMAFLHTLNTRPTQKTAASDGERWFMAYCVRCHEHNLEGISSKVNEAKLRQLVDEGHAGSPPLKDWIDPAARSAIVEYVTRL
jgi:cytochrome c